MTRKRVVGASSTAAVRLQQPLLTGTSPTTTTTTTATSTTTATVTAAAATSTAESLPPIAPLALPLPSAEKHHPLCYDAGNVDESMTMTVVVTSRRYTTAT